MQKILIGTLTSFALIGCGGGGGGGGDPTTPTPAPTTISPSDSNTLMDNLAVKVGGASGVQKAEPIPAAAADDQAAPKAISAATVSSSNGSTAQIPISFEANAAIAALYLKVTGSDSYFDVDVSSQSTKANMAEQARAKAASHQKIDQNTPVNFEVTLPSNLQAGTFEVEIGCKDAQGQNCQTSRTSVEVASVGSGEIQFSLSWDAEVDLDLIVVEPDGTQIDFRLIGSQSPSGGMIDNDDTDGTGTADVREDGLNAVENIFWTSNAPRGTYNVFVNHFSDFADGSGQSGDGEPTNFTVTVTQNGQVVDSVTINNFRGTSSGDAQFVTSLVN